MAPLFISILEGEEPETTRPIITTSDPQLIAAFADALRDRLQRGRLDGEGARQMLRLLDEGEEGEEAGGE